MRDIWYGDNRDLVKWGGLLHLAQLHAIELIVQVAFYRPSEFGGLEKDAEEIPLPGPVREHFRSLHSIDGLAGRAGIAIRLIDGLFEHSNRSNFISSVAQDLEALADRKVVLLDPDTGIAPRRHNANHVTAGEIAALWACLRPGDWLVLYQHARRTRSWLDETREEFRLATDARSVSTYRGSRLASDVALFAAAK